MNALFLGGWEANDLFAALCWTFLHSLWIGLVAAILAGTVIIGTRKSAAVIRYNLLGSILVLFLISAAVTLYLQLRSSISIQAVTIEYHVEPVGNASLNNQPAAIPPPGFIDSIVVFLNRNATVIVFIWFFVFAAKNIKLAVDLLWINRIRRHKVHSPTQGWQHKVNTLATALRIKKAVTLLQSELVKMPLTVGFFKPVILLPLGLLANLPPDQVETILLHELAHIRRRDYLVNILQTFAESVFFFNPFILWISSLLRDEREACCDDVVIDSVSHKKSYIEALVAFQEYALANPGYAMALGRKRSSMIDRVKRMLTSENKKLNNMEKLILLAGITALTAFSLVPQKENTATGKPKVTAVNNIPGELDTMPQSKQGGMDYKRASFPSISVNPSGNAGGSVNQTIVAVDQHGKKYRLERVNGRIISLAIDGVAVPANELVYHELLFRKVETTLKNAAAAKGEKAQLSGYSKLKDAEARKQPNEKMKQVDKQKHLSQELEGKGAIKAVDKGEIKTSVDKGEVKNNINKPMPVNDVKKSFPPGDPAKKGNGITETNVKKTFPPGPGSKKMPVAKAIDPDQQRVIDVVNVLIQENVVSSFNAVEWFGLTEQELVVNGVRQPAALHKKLKEQAGIKSNYGLFYGPSKLGGAGVYLDKKDVPSSKTINY